MPFALVAVSENAIIPRVAAAVCTGFIQKLIVKHSQNICMV